MPIPQLDKRTYGYTGGSTPPRRPRRPSRKQKKSRKSRSYTQKHALFPRSTGRLLSRYKKPFFMTILLIGVLGFLCITIMVAWASKDLPDPDKLTDRQIAQSTKMYDKTGEHLLYEIFADERRTIVELEDIPKDLIQGIIATEDTTFYEHKGIRPLSIVRSIITGVFTDKRIGSGASTLTQQLVKNAILTSERSYTRKLKEVLLTIRLEQKYTKEQILKIYFNEIPYGSTNYGVESAAQSYFGKSVRDLTLAESATLAGMPKAPSHYLNNPDSLKARRDFVLLRMYQEGYITEDEKNDAQAEDLTLKQTFHNIEAPHFVLYVKEKLVEQFGEAMVETGGLKVITSLDWDMQNIAERVVAEKGSDLLAQAAANNISLLAMDPNTGHILMMVGSKDFFDNDIDGQFNVATLGKRQPGSSFKPIVYAAAFEKGYTADTILYDVETNFATGGAPYSPKNYDLQEHGPVTIRSALQGSLNIPAVKTLYLVGDKKGVTFAERLGYSTLGAGNFGLSLVLGGGEVTLLDHVRAYTAFANEGEQHDAISILRVEDSTGDMLFEWKQEKGAQVIDKKIAALMSNVLSDDAARAWMFGAGGILTLPDRPVATKTGTTNNYIDAWTIGYTPSLAAGVWAGNTDNTPMNRGFGGSRVAAPIWHAFMKEALKDKPVESFPAPPKNDTEKPILRGSQGGQVTLDVDKVTGKLATSSTPPEYIERRVYIQPHSILHYVQKDDPRGSLPENPVDDPQYILWENAIQRWIASKIEKMKEGGEEIEISFEDPPTEYDDVHDLTLIPTLEIVYPQDGEIIDTPHIQTDVRVTAPRGVSKVSYMIDNIYVGVVDDHPFNLDYQAQDLHPGVHELTIIVEDDVGNRLEKKVRFILSGEPTPPNVTFAYDYNNISSSQFPYTITLQYYKIEDIQKIALYYISNNEKILAASSQDFDLETFEKRVDLVWQDAPPTGNHTLMVEVLNGSGETYETDRRDVTIVQ